MVAESGRLHCSVREGGHNTEQQRLPECQRRSVVSDTAVRDRNRHSHTTERDYTGV